MAQARNIAVKASGVVNLGASGGTANSATYNNRDAKGVTVVVKNTAGGGTSPTITVKLQEYVDGAGWYDITGATTAAIAAGTPGTTYFTVYPGVTVAANAGISRPLGKTWRIAWTIGGSSTPTGTFSVDATLHA